MNAHPCGDSAPRGHSASRWQATRTTAGRTLAHATGCAVLVFLLAYAYQEMLLGLSDEQQARFHEAAARWAASPCYAPPASAWLTMLGLCMLLGAYGMCIAHLFRRRHAAVALPALTALVVAIGLLVPAALTRAGVAAMVAACLIHCFLIGVPFAGPPGGRRFSERWRAPFRAQSFAWVLLSGWLLYYLGLMGYWCALEAGMGKLALRWAQRPHFVILIDEPGGLAPHEQALAVATLAAAMSLYHFVCSAYLLNQLAYVVARGRQRVRHRELWWPFARCRVSGTGSTAGA